MECLRLPEFSIDESSSENDIRRLLREIKPAWDVEDLIIEPLTGGFSCKITRCYLKSNPADGVTVRVRGMVEKIPLCIEKRIPEAEIVLAVSKLELFPKMYAVFKNGYCYEYVVGKPLLTITEPSARGLDDSVLRCIARRLADIHAVKLEGADYGSTQFFDNLSRIVDVQYPVDSSLNIPSKSEVREKLDSMIEYSKKLKHEYVLCHGDSHAGNMLWNDDAKQFTIVDWEAAHIGCHGYDVGYFFQSLRFPELLRPENPDSRITNDELEIKFIKMYLEEWHRVNDDDSPVTEDETRQFYVRAKYFRLMWLVVVQIMVAVFMEYDSWKNFPIKPESLVSLLHRHYLEIKDELLADIK